MGMVKALATKESAWGQLGDKGIDGRTTAGNVNSGQRTTMQQPTIVGRGKGGRWLVTRPPEGRG